MKRVLLMAGMAGLVLTAPASAQSRFGSIGGTGNSSGGFAQDVFSGNPQDVTGFSRRVTDTTSRIGSSAEDPSMGKDGCANVPNHAHFSSDCSPMIAWDPSWVLPTKPLNQLSGAEENMVRSYHILTGKPITNPEK